MVGRRRKGASRSILMHYHSVNIREMERLAHSLPGNRDFYCSENKMNNSKAICIGTTTATEAKKYTENVVIANATTVESVIAKAVKLLKT